MLVLCSRNACPQKGLVRRPHGTNMGALPREGEQASLEGSFRWMTVGARTRGSTGQTNHAPHRAFPACIARLASEPFTK